MVLRISRLQADWVCESRKRWRWLNLLYLSLCIRLWDKIRHSWLGWVTSDFFFCHFELRSIFRYTCLHQIPCKLILGTWIMSAMVPAHCQKNTKITKALWNEITQANKNPLSTFSALCSKYRNCFQILCFCFIHFKASPDLWGQKFCQLYWSVLLSRGRSELANTLFFIWYCTLLYGIVWYCMVLYGLSWRTPHSSLLPPLIFYYMVLHFIIWYCMVSFGIACYCKVLYGIMWYSMVL